MELPVPFDRFGRDPPASPVVVSVPHAGRDYPASLLSMAAIPADRLRTLEDRLIDRLALAAHRGEAMLIARRPRAWIDLNRDPRERDPRVEEDGPHVQHFARSDKVRAGLGLVPRRAGGADMAWRRRLSAAEVEARIAADHLPYHAALEGMLAAARARFGTAVLLDLHSMPPLAGERPAQLVVGDRFGRSAAARFGAAAGHVARGMGYRVAANAPYAGGHVLDRHGAPRTGVHAVQLELDRRLYLDPALDGPGAGFDAAARLVRAIIDALAAQAPSVPMAAE